MAAYNCNKCGAVFEFPRWGDKDTRLEAVGHTSLHWMREYPGLDLFESYLDEFYDFPELLTSDG